MLEQLLADPLMWVIDWCVFVGVIVGTSSWAVASLVSGCTVADNLTAPLGFTKSIF